MKIKLCVHIDEVHFSGGACIDVPDCFAMAFKPLNITDDRFIAYSSNGSEVFAGEPECQSRLRLRDDAAEYLSKHLTVLIANEMKKKDTFNGYELGDNNENQTC